MTTEREPNDSACPECGLDEGHHSINCEWLESDERSERIRSELQGGQ